MAKSKKTTNDLPTLKAFNIWKYVLDEVEINEEGYFEIEMPEGAEILKVGVQRGKPTMWAEVYTKPDAKSVKRKFVVRQTGNAFAKLPSERYGYLGTVLLMGDNWVWHIFEVYDYSSVDDEDIPF